MKFIDVAEIYVRSGNGGPGSVSFRREKYVPKGGPDGGNGGKGGSIIFVTDPHLNTLLDFKYKRHFIAQNGKPGERSKCTGKSGKNMEIRVPCGTEIKNSESGEIIADLTGPGTELTLLEGGKGGRGNAEFATPTNQTPRYAEPGLSGKELNISLELKLIADVGIVGFPNVGKSTLISVISAAKPKIADYPFTTLIPNLGIVKIKEGMNYTVADIPGLIEGASEGKGLGIQFLRHVERTKVLLFMIDSMSATPKEDYKILVKELLKYNPEMKHKKRIVCISRIDALSPEQMKEVKKIRFTAYKDKIFLISSVSHQSIDELKNEMWNKINSEDVF